MRVILLNKEIKRNIEQILNDPDMDIEFMANYIDSGLLMNHIRKLKHRLINYNQKQEQLKDIDSPNVKRFFARLRKNINGLYKRINNTIDLLYEEDTCFRLYLSPYSFKTFSVEYIVQLVKDKEIEIHKENDKYYIKSTIGFIDDEYDKEQCINDWEYFTGMLDKVILQLKGDDNNE